MREDEDEARQGGGLEAGAGKKYGRVNENSISLTDTVIRQRKKSHKKTRGS